MSFLSSQILKTARGSKCWFKKEKWKTNRSAKYFLLPSSIINETNVLGNKPIFKMSHLTTLLGVFFVRNNKLWVCGEHQVQTMWQHSGVGTKKAAVFPKRDLLLSLCADANVFASLKCMCRAADQTGRRNPSAPRVTKDVAGSEVSAVCLTTATGFAFIRESWLQTVTRQTDPDEELQIILGF